jgi:hypothetical protein
MGKYLKKFTTKDEHDSFFITEQNAERPNVSLIQSEKRTTYNPIFPLYITTWKDDKKNVHGEATKATKKLYDYFMKNSILDPTGAWGERFLDLSDEQMLYINGIKVERLYHYPPDGEIISWHPNDVWDIDSWYGWGGLFSDGSIYVEWDY